MREYATDREKADRHLDQVRKIVGPVLLRPAPDYHDRHENTDLLAVDGRVSVRIREHGYFAKYAHDITFRFARSSGVETEHSKMINGFGRYDFYGHENVDGTTVEHWMLLDLNRFRGALIKEASMPEPLRMKFTIRDNHDGTTSFIAYDIRTFPKGILLLVSDEIADILRDLPQYKRSA